MGILIDSERLANTFMDLVAIDSPSYQERQMADELTRRLTALGLSVEEDGAGETIGGSSGNLYGFLPGTLPLPPLLFCAHMDTVSPALDKRAVREQDGRIHSAGDTVLGADDLSAAAVILEVLTALRESGTAHRPVEVLFSAAEEVYCVGISAFDFSKIQAHDAYVLDYEGAIGEAVVAAPTILEFTAEVRGKASHAGFSPEAGVDAISAAAKAIASVKSGRVSEWTTLNFGLIRGGTATNIVSDRCVVKGEIRSERHELANSQLALVRNAFQEACAAAGAELDFQDKCFLRAYHLPENLPVVQRYFRACEKHGCSGKALKTFGGSDNNFLASHGINGVVIASAMHRCHSCQEFTTVQELTALAEIVADLLLDCDALNE